MLLIVISLLTSCQVQNERKVYAEILIEKVERFQEQYKRLPNNVSELGLLEKEDSPAFYQKISDSTYIIWYGLSLGESNVYDSQMRNWTLD